MHDQANHLRHLARQSLAHCPDSPFPRPRLVVVTGGKGGVGTTTIAVALAIVLAERRRRTVLVDADPQGGDATMLCGVDERYTLADVLQSRRSISEVLQPGPYGLRVVPAAWARKDRSEPSAPNEQRLIQQLHGPGPRADFTVVDAGSGPSRLAQRFWEAADAVLVVTTPDVTSVMDAYALIKVLAPGEDSAPIGTLVNMAPGRAVADEVHRRLAQACQRFLGIQVKEAGYVPKDPMVAAAGEMGRAFVTSAPGCQSVRQIRGLAELLVRQSKRANPLQGERTRQTENNP